MCLINPWEGGGGGGGGGLEKLIKVSHQGLVWCPRTLPFHVESRHQNKLIFQYTSMANEVYLNVMNKMGDFSKGEVFTFIFSGTICKACDHHTLLACGFI